MYGVTMLVMEQYACHVWGHHASGVRVWGHHDCGVTEQ